MNTSAHDGSSLRTISPSNSPSEGTMHFTGVLQGPFGNSSRVNCLHTPPPEEVMLPRSNSPSQETEGAGGILSMATQDPVTLAIPAKRKETSKPISSPRIVAFPPTPQARTTEAGSPLPGSLLDAPVASRARQHDPTDSNAAPHDAATNDVDQPTTTCSWVWYYIVIAATWIAAPFVWFFRFLFMDSIRPEDPFPIRFRKIAIGGMVVSTIGYYPDIVVLAEEGPRSMYGWYVVSLLAIPCLITIWGTFIYGRIFKRIPEWMFSVVALTPIFGRLISATVRRSIDIEPASFGYLLITLLSQLHVGVEIVAVVVSVIALTINTLILPDIGMDQHLLFPGSPQNTRPDFMELIAKSRMAFVLKTVVIMILLRQFQFLVHRAEKAAVLSKDIAAKLQRYDTQGVREILFRVMESDAQAELSQKSVDPELLSAFEGIVKNLELYRPHLPHYLFETPPSSQTDGGTEEERDSEDEGDGNGDEDGASDLDPLSDSRGGLGDGVTRFHSMSSVTGTTSAGGPSVTSSTTWWRGQPQTGNRTGATTGSSHGRALVGFGATTTSSSRRSQSLLSFPAVGVPQSPPPPEPLPPGTVPNSTNRDSPSALPVADPLNLSFGSTPICKSKVVVCLMAVDWLLPTGFDLTVELCDAFISLVHDIAHSTQASLHSFIGDRIIATWNATKRCSKPESKGCLFALRVRSAVNSHYYLKSSMSLSCITATRMAECCFAGDHRGRLFTCSSADLWKFCFSALNHIQPLHIACMDSTTKEHASYDVVSRGIAVLPFPSDSGGSGGASPSALVRSNGGPHTMSPPTAGGGAGSSQTSNIVSLESVGGGNGTPPPALVAASNTSGPMHEHIALSGVTSATSFSSAGIVAVIAANAVPVATTTTTAAATASNNSNRYLVQAPGPSHRKRCLYQLLSERVVDETKDQEWMYAVANHDHHSSFGGGGGGNKSGQDHAKLTMVVEMFAAGQTVEALNILRALDPKGDIMKDAAVQALMRQIDGACSGQISPSAGQRSTSPGTSASLAGNGSRSLRFEPSGSLRLAQ